MNRHTSNMDRLKAEAADWVLKVEAGLSLKEQAQFNQWKKDHPEAVEYLDLYQSVWTRMDLLKLGNMDSSNEPNPRLFASKSKANPRQLYLPAIAAATAAAVIAILFWVKPFSPNQDTGSSTPAIHFLAYSDSDYFELPDGSTIELNAETELKYRFTEDTRDFWVSGGEVYFTVAKDPHRPFNVFADGTLIQAIGTEFNVKFAQDRIEIMVTEGRVQVTPTYPRNPGESNLDTPTSIQAQKVEANQRATIHSSRNPIEPEISPVSFEEVDQTLSWKPVTLRFSDTSLLEVANAFNQHNHTQLVIQDDSLAQEKIDVTFRSNKLEGFVRLIKATYEVNSRREGNTIILFREL